MIIFFGWCRYFAVCLVSLCCCCCCHRTNCAALPASPVAVGTVEVTATTVRLIWASGNSGPVDPTVSYTIAYQELNDSSASEREVSDILGTEYRITGLSVYTTYLFQVVAVNNVGRGTPSSPLEVTTDHLGQYSVTSNSVLFVILINNRTAHSNASHPTSCVNFYLL